MGAIQERFKGELDGRIQPIIKQAEDERAKYEKAVANVSELKDQIMTYQQRFEALSEEITASQTNFSNFQQDKETREGEIMTLKAQITVMEQTLKKKQQVEAKIAEDKARIQKQIKTMSGLKKALSLQINQQN